MKLNKSQISAIASKIEHEQKKKFDDQVKAASKKYLGDAKRIISLEKKIDEMQEEVVEIKKRYYYYISSNGSMKPEDLAIQLTVYKVTNKVPSHTQIEEALTIASVDSNDMEQLMKNYEKFLI